MRWEDRRRPNLQTLRRSSTCIWSAILFPPRALFYCDPSRCWSKHALATDPRTARIHRQGRGGPWKTVSDGMATGARVRRIEGQITLMAPWFIFGVGALQLELNLSTYSFLRDGISYSKRIFSFKTVGWVPRTLMSQSPKETPQPPIEIILNSPRATSPYFWEILVFLLWR